MEGCIKIWFVLIALVFSTGRSFSQEAADTVVLSDETFFYSLNAALKNPEKVYKLRLQKQKLESIPDEVFMFKNLRTLDLSKNNIKDIDTRIAELKYLENLDLSKNEIDTFPEVICEIRKLKVLKMSRNNMEEIPVQIENLGFLETLELWDNDFSVFPESMSNLKSLKSLDLRGIIIESSEMNRLEDLMPGVKIHFSPACNCGY